MVTLSTNTSWTAHAAKGTNLSLSKLQQEVDDTIAIYERANGAFAARTRKMIAANGVVDALAKLVVTADAQHGFKVLRDSNQLNRSFEAIIVRFPEMFPKGAVEAAQWRLDNAHNLH